MNKKYLITTWGCQMNEHDSEKIEGILNSLGYISTDNKESANLIIYNTCLVRENAELKVYGNLGELKGLKRKNPDLIIAVCGCMMQKEEVRSIIKEKYSHVDLIFGTHNFHKLPELLESYDQKRNMLIDVWNDSPDIVENIPTKRKYDFKAFINIMYGCNNFCSYCIVPYTRGREKSRNPEDILAEAIKLSKEGYKEITLLGQNVNSYGKTLENQVTFAQLLYMLNEIEELERIRFMTSHPKDLSDELIDAIKNCDKVCNHLHLPFQAGSNKILKIMNRKYTKEKYLDLVKKIRKEIPDVSLTTDIIVGFPGETKEDFEETLDVVRKSNFDSAFTFLYSVREGTPAAKMSEQVPDEIKHERFQRLLDTLHPISLKRNKELINREFKVLVEDISKNDDTKLSGRTDTNRLIHFKGNKELISEIVNVRVTDAKTWTLEGEIVE
ncbi:tRNA (N6-isopentenyl adenosine(37)-C2)-methylthiotransferase MiaB [Clostridium sp. D2Q-14]|uniref:tRNA (N6-isopentenyl adenosine(37)-C2)-methylthiotransferase MiaB n=1 Tax=Anaeromonas gelatinilytica TaxID=2683194 RepID=UPI00193B2CEE|nr:tRNA (N6-isopentenyl adenosine(37)-C2)-methylthiotransferase MiaB [Anaeromonas gelatinilytica]MBS4535969.1 tRNA (N6-isopentenyl adenosine(37)-C2)-methylthiotransferase MiaB [Anaeromonas gelatinilytica]